MKIFMCLALTLAAASAAPAEESTRDKRGIFGEPGGLHHGPLLSTHAHIPTLHAAPLHLHSSAPLHAAPLHLHSAPLHLHEPLHLHAPLLSSHTHIDTPVLHGSHIDTLHTDVHHHAPVIHHAPLVHHAPPVIVKVIKSVHHAPLRHLIRSGW